MHIIILFNSPCCLYRHFFHFTDQQNRVTNRPSLQGWRGWVAGLLVLKPGQPQANQGLSPYQDTLPHITQARVCTQGCTQTTLGLVIWLCDPCSPHNILFENFWDRIQAYCYTEFVSYVWGLLGSGARERQRITKWMGFCQRKGIQAGQGLSWRTTLQ